jgi:hypothetical protein
MPYDVTLRGLDQAIGTALSKFGDPEDVDRCGELSRLAYDNLRHLAEITMKMIEADAHTERLGRERGRQERQVMSYVGSWVTSTTAVDRDH